MWNWRRFKRWQTMTSVSLSIFQTYYIYFVKKLCPRCWCIRLCAHRFPRMQLEEHKMKMQHNISPCFSTATEKLYYINILETQIVGVKLADCICFWPKNVGYRTVSLVVSKKIFIKAGKLKSKKYFFQVLYKFTKNLKQNL